MIGLSVGLNIAMADRTLLMVAFAADASEDDKAIAHVRSARSDK